MSTVQSAEIGIIGGSGLYDMAGLEQVEEHEVETPFGEPSDRLRIGVLEGRRVAFLARHGRHHSLLPSELNFRANMFALKKLGVSRVLSASAVGSLREDFHPLDIVLVDQFVDRTRGRISTFFGSGLVAHVGFADPVCAELLDAIEPSARRTGRTVHRGGTYVCMEGPQFSTKAESRAYRKMGFDVIGMTNLQEAKLAREAEMCFATIALVTDYDCWHEEETVSVEVVVQRLQANADAATSIVRETVRNLGVTPTCACGSALSTAILTRPERVPKQTLERLRPIVGKYFRAS